jgi:hypothetical protein
MDTLETSPVKAACNTHGCNKLSRTPKSFLVQQRGPRGHCWLWVLGDRSETLKICGAPFGPGRSRLVAASPRGANSRPNGDPLLHRNRCYCRRSSRPSFPPPQRYGRRRPMGQRWFQSKNGPEGGPCNPWSQVRVSPIFSFCSNQ